MNKILCFSFPRSGHHLLVHLLAQYFSGNIEFPEGKSHNKKLDVGDLHYCEFYRHCYTLGCDDPLVNFQKNHDFELNSTLPLEWSHIVQCRHPIESVISWIERFDRRITDMDSWHWLAKERILHWKKFMHKWAIECLPLSIVPYHNLVKNPQLYLEKIIRGMGVKNIDFDLISKIKAPERSLRDVRKSPFFDANKFESYELMVLDELEYLEIPTLFH